MSHEHRVNITTKNYNSTLIIQYNNNPNTPTVTTIQIKINGASCSLQFGFGGAENTVVVVHLRAAVAGVLKLQTLQVLLHLRGRLCGVLLRIQHLHNHNQTPTN